MDSIIIAASCGFVLGIMVGIFVTACIFVNKWEKKSDLYDDDWEYK